jgi:hypothetical protein
MWYDLNFHVKILVIEIRNLFGLSHIVIRVIPHWYLWVDEVILRLSLISLNYLARYYKFVRLFHIFVIDIILKRNV